MQLNRNYIANDDRHLVWQRVCACSYVYTRVDLIYIHIYIDLPVVALILGNQPYASGLWIKSYPKSIYMFAYRISTTIYIYTYTHRCYVADTCNPITSPQPVRALNLARDGRNDTRVASASPSRGT